MAQIAVEDLFKVRGTRLPAARFMLHNAESHRFRSLMKKLSFQRILLRVVLVALCLSGVPPLHAQGSPSSVQFTNVTEKAGIKFVHYPGNKGTAIIREVFGPGVCVADFDG